MPRLKTFTQEQKDAAVAKAQKAVDALEKQRAKAQATLDAVKPSLEQAQANLKWEQSRPVVGAAAPIATPVETTVEEDAAEQAAPAEDAVTF